MMFKQRITSALLAAGAFLALGAGMLEAQSVESIMAARERLELSDEQIQQLDEIRSQGVTQRNADMARISELRSQLQAGQIRRSELMAAMEDQEEARRARAEDRRASIDAILTDAQREQVEQMRRRGARGRAAAGQRRGVMRPRARPGFAPGGPAGPGARRELAPGGRPGFGPGNRLGFGPDAGPPEPLGDDPDFGPR